MLDCCLKREPLEEVETPREPVVAVERGAGEQSEHLLTKSL